ncbi:MAG: hypothetical protein R3236_11110 [Phycisphaeraceae bacterium]|nr:hypothetical protein [Phycisphaeraceae bacterium]
MISLPYHLASEDKPKQQLADLRVSTYAASSDSMRFKWPTHIAFGPRNQEIISDLKNNRLGPV